MKVLTTVNRSSIRNKLQNIESSFFKRYKETKLERGEFYTSNYVVKYMTRGAILSHIVSELSNKNRLDRNTIEEPIYSFEDTVWQKLFKPYGKEIYEDILPLTTICDPSMGWGAFILESFSFLYEIYCFCLKTLDVELSGTRRKYIVDKIITNNLFGVDISPLAINLATLKLYDFVANLFNSETIDIPSPNFVIGNSLLGKTFDSNKNIRLNSFVKKLDYFREEEKKGTIINWNQIFSSVNQKEGFAIIIGNPPYVNVKKIPKNEREVYSSIYRTYNANGDISNIFFELGMSLLKREGILCFITPRYWLEGTGSKKLREYLYSVAEISKIIDFRNNRTLFTETEKKLGVDTLIIFLKRKKTVSSNFISLAIQHNNAIKEIRKKDFFKKYIPSSTLIQDRWNFDRRTKLSSHIEELTKYRLGGSNKELGLEGICTIGKGCSTGSNKIFQLTRQSEDKYKTTSGEIIKISESERGCLRLLIKNSHIRNYSVKYREGYWIYLKGLNIEEFPNIHKYLMRYKGLLEKKQKKYNMKRYYDYAAYRSISLINHSPKIVTPYQSELNKFAIVLETNPTINETDVVTIIIKENYSKKINWFYLLSILNSALIDYYAKTNNKMIHNLYDFRTKQIEGFPIVLDKNTKVMELIGKILFELSSLLPNPEAQKYFNLLHFILNASVLEKYFSDLTGTDLYDMMKSHCFDFDAPIAGLSSTAIKKQREKVCTLACNGKIEKNIKNIFMNDRVREIVECSFLKNFSKLDFYKEFFSQ